MAIFSTWGRGGEGRGGEGRGGEGRGGEGRGGEGRRGEGMRRDGEVTVKKAEQLATDHFLQWPPKIWP